MRLGGRGVLEAREAELAALSGRSVSLEAPLHEAWHLDDVWPIGWLGGDLLLRREQVRPAGEAFAGKARFGMADSYDRASRALERKGAKP